MYKQSAPTMTDLDLLNQGLTGEHFAIAAYDAALGTSLLDGSTAGLARAFQSDHKRHAELLVANDHFTMRFRNGDVYIGRFTLDPINKPRAMDLFIEEGPEAYRGKVSRAIYEFDTDHLIWCPAEPGRSERLRAFPPDDDRDHLCIIFRRQKNR